MYDKRVEQGHERAVDAPGMPRRRLRSAAMAGREELGEQGVEAVG